MTVTTLDDYRTRIQDRPILGHIAWVTAKQTLVPHAHIKADLEAAGLGHLVPSPTAVSDQWRKAVSAQDRKGVKIGDKTVNVLVRKLVDNKEEILRSLIVETIDEQGRRIDYSEVAHVSFNKDTQRMRIIRLVDSNEQVETVIADLRAAFDARLQHGGCKDQDDLRSLLTKALKDNKAVRANDTGGIYFVPREHADTLAKLEQVAAGWKGTKLHSLPLVDDEDGKQRNMVAEGVRESVLLDVDQLMAEVREHKENMSTRRAASIVKRKKEIAARLASYQDLLEDNLADARDRLMFLELSTRTVLAAA